MITATTAKITTALLVHDAWDAVSQPQLWPKVLDAIAALFKARIVNFHCIDPLAMNFRIQHAHGADPGLLAETTYNPIAIAGFKIPTMRFRSVDDLVPRSTIRGTPFEHYIQRFAIHHVCGANIALDIDCVAAIGLARDEQAGAFAHDELRALDSLLPPLRATVELERRRRLDSVPTFRLPDPCGPLIREAVELEAQRREIGSRPECLTERTLDLLAAGIFVIDENMGLLVANAAARRLINRGELRINSNRLAIVDPDHDKRFQRLVAEAARRSGGGGAGAMLLDPPHRRTVARMIRVLPIGPMVDDAAHGPHGSVLVIVGPNTGVAVPAAVLRSAYGLTRAETAVARDLCFGNTTRGVALALGIGVATVRSHLHHIFEKTGASTQAELVRRLAFLPLVPPEEQ